MHVLNLISENTNVLTGTVIKIAKVNNSLESPWWSLLILPSRFKSTIRSSNPNANRYFTQAIRLGNHEQPWGLYWRDKNQRNRKREMDRKVSTSPRREETFSWWRYSQFKNYAATTGKIQPLKFVGGCALVCWHLDKQMRKSVHWPLEQPILRCSEVI